MVPSDHSEKSPFACPPEDATTSMWQGNGSSSPSRTTNRATLFPDTTLRADLASRRSHSTPDMASFLAQNHQTIESAPSFSFHAGTPNSAQGPPLAPRRSVSMPDGANLKLWSDAELIALADRMQQGLNIPDRMHHLKKYPCCFTGADAVRWLKRSGNAGSNGEALLLGNDMLRAGLLHHVKYKRPFEKNGNLYRFLEARSGASNATEDSHTDSSTLSSPVEGQDFARRGVGVPLRGVQHEHWSTASELARLQRRVVDLAAELEEYKELNNVMLDSMTLQLRNEQQLFALQQHRLERTIRRGTWIAIQLQIVWVLLVVLLSWLATARLSQQPPSFLRSLAQAAVPILAVVCTLSVLCCRPWLLAPPRKIPEAKQGPAEAGMQPGMPERGADGKAEEVGSEVEVVAEAAVGGAEQQKVHLCALSEDELGRLQRPPLEEDFGEWSDAPLLLRAAPLPYQQLPEGANPCAIRINDGRRIEFETELFRGCAVIWAKGLSSAPEGLFAGEKRKTSITIQGRFKRDVGVEDVVTGQEFGRRPKNLPAMWLVEKVLIKLAKKISPSMDIGPLSAPYLLASVLAMAQLVNVSRPGDEPDPAQPIPEDMRLFDPSLTDNDDGPMNALKRKKFFWDPKHRAGRSFTSEHVWTFQLYQHFVDMGAYELNMIYGFDLGRHLDGQPLQFMLKDRSSGQYLFNFHAWHRKLLPAAHAAQERSGKEDSTAA